jgi:uncharacterized protein (TIGR02391 family)
MSSGTKSIPPFSAQHIEAICKVLGDTSTGLTGSEIGHLLLDSKLPDPAANQTKWKRLHNAFAEFQNSHQVGNNVLAFIVRAMNPARYTSDPTLFRYRLDRLNPVLAFSGMVIGENGKPQRIDVASNISEALKRANRLHEALTLRQVHHDVLAYCRAELLEENYFHAVFEAMKSITGKLRQLTGSSIDGADLVHYAFGDRDSPPLLVINAYDTETLQMEQRGFMSLLKGLYGTIRNPLAHDPKIEWDMNEQDTLDILTMISLVHRKLDKTRRNWTR